MVLGIATERKIVHKLAASSASSSTAGLALEIRRESENPILDSPERSYENPIVDSCKLLFVYTQTEKWGIQRFF